MVDIIPEYFLRPSNLSASEIGVYPPSLYISTTLADLLLFWGRVGLKSCWYVFLFSTHTWIMLCHVTHSARPRLTYTYLHHRAGFAVHRLYAILRYHWNGEQLYS